MNKLRMFIGLLLMVLGSVLVISSYNGLTGHIISTESNSNLTYIALIGVLTLISGILIILSTEQERYRKRDIKLQRALGGQRYSALSEEDRNTYNKSLRRYEDRIDRNKKYQLKISTPPVSSIKNSAADALSRGYIPENTSELLRIARGSGYGIDTGGDGYIIRDSSGTRITDIGKHPNTNRNTARRILSALATGVPQGASRAPKRKSA